MVGHLQEKRPLSDTVTYDTNGLYHFDYYFTWALQDYILAYDNILNHLNKHKHAIHYERNTYQHGL